jgi:hypothetical protein
LNNQKSSRIVPAMKRTSLFAAVLLLSALPVFAQSNEFGFIVGGSRLFVDGADSEPDVVFSDSTFSLSNNSFDLFWATQMEPATWLRFKVGRIQTPIPIAYIGPDNNDQGTEPNLYRRDVDGEVQHAEVNVEYRFSEPYGSTGLFAGVGLYRQSAPDEESTSNFGFNAGVNADFPITRRYGVVLEAAYHWNRTEFQPRYLTFGGGLRVSF